MSWRLRLLLPLWWWCMWSERSCICVAARTHSGGDGPRGCRSGSPSDRREGRTHSVCVSWLDPLSLSLSIGTSESSSDMPMIPSSSSSSSPSPAHAPIQSSQGVSSPSAALSPAGCRHLGDGGDGPAPSKGELRQPSSSVPAVTQLWVSPLSSSSPPSPSSLTTSPLGNGRDCSQHDEASEPSSAPCGVGSTSRTSSMTLCVPLVDGCLGPRVR